MPCGLNRWARYSYTAHRRNKAAEGLGAGLTIVGLAHVGGVSLAAGQNLVELGYRARHGQCDAGGSGATNAGRCCFVLWIEGTGAGGCIGDLAAGALTDALAQGTAAK